MALQKFAGHMVAEFHVSARRRQHLGAGPGSHGNQVWVHAPEDIAGANDEDVRLLFHPADIVNLIKLRKKRLIEHEICREKKDDK